MKQLLTSFAILFAFPLASFAGDRSAPAIPASIGGYWQGFVEYWSRTFGTATGVVGVAVLLGAFGIFLITRGKWIK